MYNNICARKSIAITVSITITTDMLGIKLQWQENLKEFKQNNYDNKYARIQWIC